MLLEFTISIEIPYSDDLSHDEIVSEEAAYSKMLSDMEEVVGKANYSVYDSEWNYL